MIKNENTGAHFSTEQRAQIERELIRKSTAVPSRDSAAVNVPQPLSSAQESLWFLNQLEPDSPLYNIPEAVLLRGHLNVDALKNALQTIFRRHEVLRARFVAPGGKPMQFVDDNASLEVPVIDLSRLPEAERKVAAIERVRIEANRGFDLSCGPVCRASLFKLTSDQHILSIVAHHIVSDLWSFSILHDELTTLYKSFCASIPLQLPPLIQQFSAYAALGRERIESGALNDQIAAWKTQLAGELVALELPIDRPRPARQTFHGAREKIKIRGQLFTSVRELARKEHTTPFIFLLAAFQTLLHRYSLQDNFLVGTPISTRNSSEAEKLIGYFINMLPMRADFSGDPTFRELLQRAHQTALMAFGNPEVPAEKIAEQVQWPRHSLEQPLFQVVFQFSPGVSVLTLDGLSSEPIDVAPPISKFDLTLSLMPESASPDLGGNIEFNIDLFEASTIRRMIGHFEAVLNAITTNPSCKISELPLLTNDELKQIEQWNKTETDYPRNCAIHELFELQATQTPEAIALTFGCEQVTYRELNCRANQVGHSLRRLGIGPGEMVALCIERSVELIVGVLGILKAGGAYVTLDASYPPERLSYMIQDSGALVLVTTSKFKNLSGENIKTVCLDDEGSFPQEDELDLKCKVSPEDPAYVIYTSGSTGQPKAVVIPHRGVVRLVKNTNYLRFDSNDVFLQFAPISFDASTLEIFGPLLNGGKLVIFPPNFDSLEQLASIIRRESISTLWLTAGLFHQMIEHHASSLENVKFLLAGGDVLSVPHVLKALRELPGTTLINGYGPTENTTFTCCHEIPRYWCGGRSVPIGKPISNTQVYILDRQMRQVPIGITGELYIGGDGLALRYLNAPELNSAKFCSNPFRPEETIYRTGDLARWLSDGTIEFSGRVDTQVKIRGFRIELAEIEKALAENPQVQQAVVVARQDNASTKQLVAYVASKGASATSMAELRHFLQQKLPGYMVPNTFVFLESLPLNANGKLDRKKLPAPDAKDLAIHKNVSQPLNPAEEKLAQIWTEVLGLKDIGVDDNFFEIGGHSLLATRVVSRIHQMFGVEVPLRVVFEAQTIRTLAQVISENEKPVQTAEPPLTRRVRSANRRPAPLMT